MGAIFISYRRDDSRHAAGRLVDRLGQTFRRDQLFMDVDAIEPGLDFHAVLNEKVAACTVMLAVIGPEWLDARDAEGQRRLDNPNGFVRLEIETALKRDVRLIPVLVDGAQMPPEAALPEPLKGLVRRQSVRIAHERFGAEAGALAQSLAPILQQTRSSSPGSRQPAASWSAPLYRSRPAIPISSQGEGAEPLRAKDWLGVVGGTAIGLGGGLAILYTRLLGNDFYSMIYLIAAFSLTLASYMIAATYTARSLRL